MNSLSAYGGTGGTDLSPAKRTGIDYLSTIGLLDKEIRTVTYKKSVENGFEFSVRGGRELGIGIYVSRVDPFSEAEKSGIKPGDQILSVNGKPFDSITLQDAIQVLKSTNLLILTLCNVGRIPYSCILHQTYTWVDRHGRRVSPPDEYEPQFHRSSSTWSLYSATKTSKLRKVTLCLEEGETLGLMIRGGTEYGLGIFITGVDPDSPADRSNLLVGDQILEVNEVSFEDIMHDEAVRILKNSKHLVMKILDVGKIPFSCTMYDEMLWSTPGVDAPDDLSSLSLDDELSTGDPCFMLSDPDTLKILNEKAKLLLGKKEHATLNYYRTEYERGQVTLDAFVAVLLEILNTADKFSLLAEIRELIPITDREKFDDMIYSRELEIKKTCQKLGPSLDNLLASRKASKTRRNSADCYKYLAIDKGTGKICLHPEKAIPDKERFNRRSLSSVDTRRRLPYPYEGCNRSMFLSSQALNWTTDELCFDDSRTPSEDSGVDLPNGYYHANKDFQWRELYHCQNRHLSALDITQKATQEAKHRREMWAQRRHSSGGESSLDTVIFTPDLMPVYQTTKKRSVSHSSMVERLQTAAEHNKNIISTNINTITSNININSSSSNQHISRKTDFSHNSQYITQTPLVPPVLPRQLPVVPPRSQSQSPDIQLQVNRRRMSRTLPNIPQLIQDPNPKNTKKSILPEKQYRVFIPKVKAVLGIAIEGGADTCHALPRIINILPQGAAAQTIGIKVGQVILSVNGQNLIGLPHKDVANLITKTFVDRSQPEMELIVGELKKPTLEMRRRSCVMATRDVKQ
ncbi:Deafness, autosomal recessive 31 [Chamberlinius hualienensis]